MSLLAGLRATMIYNEFGLTPKDENFFPIWEQILAIENGLTDQ